MKDNMIRDALQNLREESGASVDYGRGVLVGVVSALAASSNSKDPYQSAIKRVFKLMPKGYRKECIPSPWKNDFMAMEKKA